MLMDSQLVWARDPNEGYIQGNISEIGPAEFEVVPVEKRFAKRICAVDDIFPSCEGAQDHDDNCKLCVLYLHFKNMHYFDCLFVKYSILYFEFE